MIRFTLILLLLLPFVNFTDTIRNFIFIALGGGLMMTSVIWVVVSEYKDRAEQPEECLDSENL